MFTSRQHDVMSKVPNSLKVSYSVLRELAINCKLTMSDREALAEHIMKADRIGGDVYILLARLLSMKLLYASALTNDEALPCFAASGSHVTFQIDDLEPQSRFLFHNNESNSSQNGIHVATLLGATLIGLRSGANENLLQNNGSFRRIHLINVTHPSQI